MTDLEERLRATLRDHENDIDASTVRRDYAPLGARRTVDRRLFPVLVAVAVSAVITLVAYVAWPSGGTDVNQPAGSPGTAETQPHSVDDDTAPSVGASRWGVDAGIAVIFDDDRVVTDARLVMTDGTPDGNAGLYLEDGRDAEGEYGMPLDAAAGLTLRVSATVLPACGVEVSAAPVFELETRPAGGDPRTDTVAVSELAWRQAVQDWCASGVHALLGGAETTPDGEVTQTLGIYNPGPDPVTVICAALDGWDYAEVTVEGGTYAELTTHGFDVDWDSDPPLTANGEPLPVLDS